MTLTEAGKLAQTSQKMEPPPHEQDKQDFRSTKGVLSNRYVAARGKWDGHYGELIESANRWRKIAFVNGAGVLLLAGALLYTVFHPHAPYVIVLDPDGREVASGSAARLLVPDERLKQSQLVQWVSDLRMVTTDGWVQRAVINNVYAKIDNGSAAREFINEFYRSDPPQKRAQTYTVHVEVRSILPVSKDTYEVEWTEAERNLQGQVQSQKRWKGAFTIALSPVSDERVARLNPLGMYITQARWNEVLSGGDK